MLCLLLAAMSGWSQPSAPSVRKVGENELRILTPTVLELILINTRPTNSASVSNWNLVTSNYLFLPPNSQEFTVTADGQPFALQAVSGFKRRVLYAPLQKRDLRIQNALYLRLAQPVADGQSVEVHNPSGTLWSNTMTFRATCDPLRYSPAIHVNQEGYAPAFPKKAMVGYYMGSAGELNIPTDQGFHVIDVASGATVFQGPLTRRPDVGYSYTPNPYQQVYVADFTSLTNAGQYQLVVPGLGASYTFRIEEGAMMNFARTYALGLYHQRCGTSNDLPFTRFSHGPCHIPAADVPSPQFSYQFTWNKIASYSANYTNDPRHTAPPLAGVSSQLYPFVRTGKIDVSGGHHDAGDYSKYTINSASFVHQLMFAVDSFAGVAGLDNMGLPESGDGIGDVLQEAKWEADFLAKMQDTDGGFYFLVYPKEREYESNVLPDRGDPQVVWPKTTAVTAAAVAALAQCSSSPAFKQHYPEAAALYLQKAQLGWNFLTNAIARYGLEGSYQKITHYGDEFMHDDELAWAACEMYLATGATNYQQKLMAWFPNPNNVDTYRWTWWRSYAGYGAAIRSYAFAARSGRLPPSLLNTTYLGRCETEVRATAQDALTRSQKNAYGTSFPLENKSYRTAGWYFSLERAFDIAVGYQLDQRADYLEAMVANLNYEAGCNPVNICYIAGLGWQRPREIVHQYAQNDRRVLPPSGFPFGNIHSKFPWSPTYGSELYTYSFPSDSASSGPYPFYDRWSDAYNVEIEFVSADQARALGTLAFLAAATGTRTQPWNGGTAQIILPNELAINQPATAYFLANGFDLKDARIVWEARNHEPAYGQSFTVLPTVLGTSWIEAEAQLSDGRRLVAVTQFVVTTNPPPQPTNIVAMEVADSSASPSGPDPGVIGITRLGDTNSPLAVSYNVSGTAVEGTDFAIWPSGSSSGIIFAPGQSTFWVVILPTLQTNPAPPKTVTLTLKPGPGYMLQWRSNATVNIAGISAAITVTRSQGGLSRITWATTPGKVYQVLYRNTMTAPWTVLSPELPASSSSLSWSDPTLSLPPQRFYRVAEVR